MTKIWCVSDLHGNQAKYEALFNAIALDSPDVLLIAGDLLPGWHSPYQGDNFTLDYLGEALTQLKRTLGSSYPDIFVILGNDDPRINEPDIIELENRGLWTYAHMRKIVRESFDIYGYSFVPPTPFRSKDWEKYDVSRYVDPGCVSPEEGSRTIEVNPVEVRYGTIKDDLQKLTHDFQPERAVMIFHSPPYKTCLDRAPLDGQMVDYVPMDVHVGSIAIQEFIQQKQPRITFHGHVHESTRLTGSWKQQTDSSWSFQAATDSDDLCIIIVSLDKPEIADIKYITTS